MLYAPHWFIYSSNQAMMIIIKYLALWVQEKEKEENEYSSPI